MSLVAPDSDQLCVEVILSMQEAALKSRLQCDLISVQTKEGSQLLYQYSVKL